MFDPRGKYTFQFPFSQAANFIITTSQMNSAKSALLEMDGDRIPMMGSADSQIPSTYDNINSQKSIVMGYYMSVCSTISTLCVFVFGEDFSKCQYGNMSVRV